MTSNTGNTIQATSADFVEVYKARMLAICANAHKELGELPKDVISSPIHIQKMIREVVEVSMQGLNESEREWILNRHLGEYMTMQ